MLAGLLALPSTALVLSDVADGGDPDVQALRGRVARLVADLAGADALVVAADPLAAHGPMQILPRDGQVSLSGLGMPAAQARVEDPHLDALPRCAEHPGPDLAVLAVLARRAGASRVALLGLPPGARDDAIQRATSAILEAIARADRAVVVAADLSAGHGPKPPRPDVGQAVCDAFDSEVLSALTGHPTTPTAARLTAGAQTTGARGIPGLLLAMRLAEATGRRPQKPTITTLDGVSAMSCAWRNDAEDPYLGGSPRR